MLLIFLHLNQPIHLKPYSNNGQQEFHIVFELWSIEDKFLQVTHHHVQM